ncbi:MBL fold metallo-hydrolase [Paraburkholderia sp. J11-2]|uniref:MBL fold metallo-hydrolase n=1 Tax=Paraburkholderia sp. J11-2 TaxID=2805431 RepID=UPI002AB6CC6E|nr:MBL fold metallo-hydrolase [Paraburkholderia sp. J11-2]
MKKNNSAATRHFRGILPTVIALSLGLAVSLSHAAATPATADSAMEWITLGTNGGPVIFKERSEPANLLMVNGKPWLIDCGDGAMERLAAVGYQARDLSTVWLSHLHMDHIGGVQGLIGLRWMLGGMTPMTIYGPPGTQELVDGIVKALGPSANIAKFEPMHGMPLDQMIKVVIVEDGADMQVDGVRVRAVRNSHFDMPLGHHLPDGTQSLALRFDSNGKSVTYTGDTGPADAIATLAKGTDLLVSEVIDRDAMVAELQANKQMSDKAKKEMTEHFDTQHLSPEAAGTIAAKAGARHLVYTHISIVASILTPNDAAAERASLARIKQQTQKVFKGQVTLSEDLQRFPVGAEGR